jgi:hypothetical protein
MIDLQSLVRKRRTYSQAYYRIFFTINPAVGPNFSNVIENTVRNVLNQSHSPSVKKRAITKKLVGSFVTLNLAK